VADGAGTESWGVGAAYEPFIGRWSRPIAREFVRWLHQDQGRRWLELGCGTGALTHTILAAASPASVVATDRSRDYVRYARAGAPDPRGRFVVGDAVRLPLSDRSADVVVSGLLLNFLPDPAAGLAEMCRVAGASGTVAAYVWDYAGRMELLRIFWDEAVALDPSAAPLDEGRRFPICAPEALERLWHRGGLTGVESTGLEVTTRFADFDDYWRPFLGGQGPAPAYVASLDPGRRDRLRERLRDRLAAGPGPIVLRGRSWAVRGRRPT
jgi:SAM-dependent methyltransferase